MRFRLLPKDQGFYDLFDEAAQNVTEAARCLHDLVANYTDTESKLAKVIVCENRGDELTDTILRRLDTTFVTPFDREDIHALTERLDDVVDDILAAADLLVLHGVEQPLPGMVELSATLVTAAEKDMEIIGRLSAMKGMDPALKDVDRLESEGDKIYRRTVAKLFSGEFKAFEVLRMKDVVEALEQALNGVEAVSNICESIVLKHA